MEMEKRNRGFEEDSVVSKPSNKSSRTKTISKVFILGKEYSVETSVPNLMGIVSQDGHTLGSSNSINQTIIINSQQHPEGVADTLLHEMLHAIDFQTQLELTERQVHVLASSLLQVMWDKRNKYLFEMLMK